MNKKALVVASILAILFSATMSTNAASLSWGPIVQSPALEPRFNLDVAYAYAQGDYATLVYNITYVSSTDPKSSPAIIEVYKIEASSGGQIITSKALGLATNSLPMDVLMNITVSLPAYHSEVFGAYSDKSYLREDSVPLHANIGSGPIVITVKRLGWITVDGDLTEEDLSWDELIQQVQVEKFGNGFLYNTIVPEEQLPQTNLFSPLDSPSPSSSPSTSPSASPAATPTNPEPSTTLVAAASGASAAIIGIGLLIYFKKRNH